MTFVLPQFFRLSKGWSTFFFDEDNVSLYHTNTEPHAFECFYRTPLESLKVVVLGSSPYSKPFLRTGLCYEVPYSSRIPSSLQFFYNKLEEEGYYPTRDGSLDYLARQGVLFLNTRFVNVEEDKTEILFQKLVEYIIRHRGCVLFLCMTPEVYEKMMKLVPVSDQVVDICEKGVIRRINQLLFTLYNTSLKI